MIKYQCYEPDCEGIYTEAELQELYDATIDKGDFEDFGSWLDEMLNEMILRIWEG